MTDLASEPTVGVDVLAVGRVLAGRFEIGALLGAGGMGAVYRARDRELDEAVAVKTLRPELAARDEAVQRFRREVQLARRVTHPNVVRTFDLGVDGAIRFLTMELVVGASLAAHAPGALPLADALRVTAEIARGLAAAHAAGVVHRDLKPGNVILAGARVAITDFGIARIAADGDGARVTGGALIGTPAYMAPEQVEGGAIDGRADVYALGVVLYELLTGALPFTGETPLAAAVARLGAEPPDVRARAPGVPDGVAALVAAMLRRDRGARPDAQSVLDRLEPMLGGAARVGGAVAAVAPVGGGDRTGLELATPSAQLLAIAVRPVDAGAAAAASPVAILAADLTRAVKDGVARAFGRVGAEADAGVICDATVRAQGAERVRVRARLVDRAGAALWAESIDGVASAQLDLEDAVVAAVVRALRPRAGGAAGPLDPAIRARYEEARADADHIDPAIHRRGVAALEQLHAEAPLEPWVASALAVALCKLQRLGELDDARLARAEDLALRALASAEAPALAYYAVALVRVVRTDLRAALRAAVEALRRAPRLAEAHQLLGTLLCQLGRLDDGLARLRLAVQLDPALADGFVELAQVHAICGERAAALDALARAEAANRGRILMVRVRLPFLLDDRALAAAVAAELAAVTSPHGTAWEAARPALEAFAAGAPLADAAAILDPLTADAVPPRARAFMQQVATEYYACVGARDAALAMLARGAANPGFANLLWLDRAGPLAALRGAPEFAAARALVAARAARVLEA